MSGGDPTAILAHGVSCASATNGAVTRRTTKTRESARPNPLRGHGAEGGGEAFPNDAPAHFWRAVASGAARLSPAEDALIWRLRGLHWRWDFIAAEICAKRARVDKRSARYWREQYRGEAKPWRQP